MRKQLKQICEMLDVYCNDERLEELADNIVRGVSKLKQERDDLWAIIEQELPERNEPPKRLGGEDERQ